MEARSQMMKSGTIVLIFKADKKSKMLTEPIKLETRGFVYVDEVREAHRMIIAKARNIYNETIKNVPDMEEKDMVRAMLSESLQAVISQTLLKKNGGGRVAAHEIMIGTPAIRNLIRENKIAQMYSAIQTGAAQGMTTLDQTLKQLVAKGQITAAAARNVAKSPEAFM